MPPEPGRRERRKQATRLAIMETGIRLMHQHGIDTVTMEEIAAQADVAKATLYAYFPSKDAIIAEWIREQNRAHEGDLVELLRTHPTTRARLHRLVTGVSAWHERHRPFVAAYVRYRLSSLGVADPADHAAQGSGFRGFLAAVVAAGQELGDVRTDVPAAALIRALEGAYLYVIRDWLAAEGGHDLGQACVAMVDLFLDGAGARGGRS